MADKNLPITNVLELLLIFNRKIFKGQKTKVRSLKIIITN